MLTVGSGGVAAIRSLAENLYLAFRSTYQMQWDKFKVAQDFLQKANAIHPEDEDFPERHDFALAKQDVYYDCYMSSFSREDLIKRLRQIIGGDVQLPEEQVNAVIYRETYIKEATKVLSEIEGDGS